MGDRANNRIQIFDQNGKYLAEWKHLGRPTGLFISKDDTIYVADAAGNAYSAVLGGRTVRKYEK